MIPPRLQFDDHSEENTYVFDNVKVDHPVIQFLYPELRKSSGYRRKGMCTEWSINSLSGNGIRRWLVDPKTQCQQAMSSKF